MNNIFYVYTWTRLDKNYVFYVGKGHGSRYKDLNSRNKYFTNIVNKIGMENIQIDIIENDLTEEQAFEKEKYYINYYKELGCKLTNMTSGGDGSSDWYTYLSEEEKQRHKEISKSFLGKTHTNETKEKIRKAHIGMSSITEAGRKKLSDIAKNRESYWKGKHLSEETKRKISETRIERQIANPNRKPVYVLNNKYEINEIIQSRTKAMELYGYGVRTCVEQNKESGNFEELKSYNNFYFIYENDYELLKSQSTIETIAFDEANVNNGVEYISSETLDLEVRGVS